MKKKLIWILGLLFLLVYAGLAGTGAKLQLDAAQEFRQMKAALERGEEIDQTHYTATAQRSEELKSLGRKVGRVAYLAALALAAVGLINWKEYILVVGIPMLAGGLAILPFWLQSDVGAVSSSLWNFTALPSVVWEPLFSPCCIRGSKRGKRRTRDKRVYFFKRGNLLAEESACSQMIIR